MLDTIEADPGTSVALPSRLHHAAYVSADAERTRQFYEEVIGLPLIGCWIEREEVAGELHEFSHSFYGLADGGALAFFNFADPALSERYSPTKQSFFVHLALQTERTVRDALRRRLSDAGVAFHEIDHGFTHSLYVVDPDGQQIEFCVDADDIDDIMRYQRATARSTLARWCEGDRTSTNNHRR